MRHHHGPNNGCPRRIVHPTKYDCVHHCTESVVEHIHPSHTTVMNHHLVRNRHFYPHTTSIQNTRSSVDEFGGAFDYPPQVSPAAMGPGNQAMGPMEPGMNPGNEVAGAMDPGNFPGYHHPMMHNKHKWC